ncbi:MAG: hypothetical protein BWZ10_02503 [candidate division BRC1 bacterium ADurb.BinA364]|nr:MAG: hypothetical protein BWZ10_02503 [candidate division BRC1 bacterium ADurb.BinA364]
MLADQESVVGGEDDARVVHQAHFFDGFQQVAGPAIDERGFGGVERAAVVELRVAIHVAAAVDRVAVFHTLVFRVVEVLVPKRSVPGLVRIEGVDIEAEFLVLPAQILAFEPLGGFCQRAGAISRLLGGSRQVEIGQMLRPVFRAASLLRVAGLLLFITGQPVHFLAANPFPAGEVFVKIEVFLGGVRRILDGMGDIAAFVEQFGEGDGLFVERRPAFEGEDQLAQV